MLMAHPTVLRNLVERYETLRAAVDTDGPTDPETKQQLQDTVYTLCVSTGTREIGTALATAREHIAQRSHLIPATAASAASAADRLAQAPAA
ncbi:MAG TPA: DUF5133 domain-containing protein [Streptomyces sp.]